MTPENFSLLATLLKQRSGLVLTDDKEYLVNARFVAIAQQLHISPEDIWSRLRLRDKVVENIVIEAMTVNETLFFRDAKCFDSLKNTVLPNLYEARKAKRSLRLWSAAASTGQEAYSLAMLLRDDVRFNGWEIEIIASDICSEALAKLSKGRYSQFEVQRGLPISLLMRHFTKDGDGWVIKPEVKAMVKTQPFNLMHHPNNLGKFDLILCRYVLIYFDPATKSGVLNRLSSALHDDGYLILGGSETALGLCDKLEREDGSIYRLALPSVGRAPVFNAPRPFAVPAASPAVTA